MEVGDRSRGARLKVGSAIGLVIVVALIGAVTLLGGDGGDSEKPVSEVEARAFFDQVVAAARARDWDKLCALNGAPANCQADLDSPFQKLRDTLPPDPPTIVATRFHEKQSADGSTGRVLVVEGTDGRGRPYRTEVMVSRYEGKLEGTNVVYWSGNEIFERDRNERRLRENQRPGKG
ncbi:MAG: hypothetical protein LC792_11500 [Actinobacteria bacterium]|nr:hypothetical protein [Actinomycetota bacterium]